VSVPIDRPSSSLLSRSWGAIYPRGHSLQTLSRPLRGLQRILVEDPASQRAIAADATPGHLGASLRVARDALVDAIGTAYYVAAGIVVVAGLVVLVLNLRRSKDAAPPRPRWAPADLRGARTGR
jgi:hypothetical protein